MPQYEQSQHYKSFKTEVLVQDQFFAYDVLVKWLHKNKLENFMFFTKSTKYDFETTDKGVVIYVYSIPGVLINKLFCSFKEFLPSKSFFCSPENIAFSCSI